MTDMDIEENDWSRYFRLESSGVDASSPTISLYILSDNPYYQFFNDEQFLRVERYIHGMRSVGLTQSLGTCSCWRKNDSFFYLVKLYIKENIAHLTTFLLTSGVTIIASGSSPRQTYTGWALLLFGGFFTLLAMFYRIGLSFIPSPEYQVSWVGWLLLMIYYNQETEYIIREDYLLQCTGNEFQFYNRRWNFLRSMCNQVTREIQRISSEASIYPTLKVILDDGSLIYSDTLHQTSPGIMQIMEQNDHHTHIISPLGINPDNLDPDTLHKKETRSQTRYVLFPIFNS